MSRRATTRKNLWPFSDKRTSPRQTTAARGGIAAHSKAEKRGGDQPKAIATYRGYKISKTPDGEFFSSLDPQSWYETRVQVKRSIDQYFKGRSNPKKYERCVSEVKAKGGANAYAVCAPLRKGKNPLALASLASLPEVNSFGKKVSEFVKGKKSKNSWNPRNPESGAISMSERFHGRPVQEIVEVIEEKHYHDFLAELGILMRLKVKACNGGIVDLDFDDDTLLCSNESGSQLYIRGGDQSVDLGEFGIETDHDYEDLGAVKEIRYYTTKEHLGSEGGEATYYHHFGEEDKEKGLKPRLPRLIYSTRDNLLSLKGGGYTVEPEGIRN